MPDPAIRLRILVAPDGSSSVSGVEKVIAPIRKAVKDASRQATQDLNDLGKSVEKIIRRMQGFTKTSSGNRFFNLKDVVGSLDSIDRRLTNAPRRSSPSVMLSPMRVMASVTESWPA